MNENWRTNRQGQVQTKLTKIKTSLIGHLDCKTNQVGTQVGVMIEKIKTSLIGHRGCKTNQAGTQVGVMIK